MALPLEGRPPPPPRPKARGRQFLDAILAGASQSAALANAAAVVAEAYAATSASEVPRTPPFGTHASRSSSRSDSHGSVAGRGGSVGWAVAGGRSGRAQSEPRRGLSSPPPPCETLAHAFGESARSDLGVAGWPQALGAKTFAERRRALRRYQDSEQVGACGRGSSCAFERPPFTPHPSPMPLSVLLSRSLDRPVLFAAVLET